MHVSLARASSLLAEPYALWRRRRVPLLILILWLRAVAVAWYNASSVNPGSIVALDALGAATGGLATLAAVVFLRRYTIRHRTRQR